MDYGSVCSGIEAASVAWGPLGWKPSWFSEIEAFPSAVLGHHWPEVENLGDMLDIPDLVESRLVNAPAVLVGGTPCQSFSLAGRRGGLADERGALTLAYVEILNRIDEVRKDNGDEECIAVWENVPGVLSSKDNAFGCLLAGLAGEDEPLQPSGKNGRTQVLCMDPKEQSHGGSSTPNISEWPNDAAALSLSQVLETGSSLEKFFVSTRACAGIMRRLDQKNLHSEKLSLVREVAGGMVD